ncbi:S9 family peptidase [Amycolatopsis jejuensis]|uniref:S9 family peptidase n=1 Tax=Amycolatopsis jejuensis TaxID=330084 RepID=UPI00052696EA|nr:DPP IV N-terminal domain-containing protein [Amycolatopsis jejuensis]
MSDRYRKAHSLVPELLPGMMRNHSVKPNWTGEGDRFWYRRDADGGGHEYVLVDPDGFQREPLFDPAEITARLSAVFDDPVDLAATPVARYRQDGADVHIGLLDGRSAVLGADGDTAVPGPDHAALPSPDGTRALFLRENNLWLRENDAERPLTTDGEPFHAWGAMPDYTRAMLPLAIADRTLPPALTCFSPSGRFVLTGRLDEREMPEHPFVDQLPPDRARPRLRPFRYYHVDETPSGDHQLAVLDLETGGRTMIAADDDLLSQFASTGPDAVTWSSDETSVYLLVHTTGARTGSLVRVDVQTGEKTVVLSETAEPIYETNTYLYSLPLIRVLPESNEVIWFSQEDGWGHLYRHDLTTGARLGAITSGHLAIRDILRVDERRREVIFVAGCGDGGENPYWRKVYRADLDGGAMTLLTPEPADHDLIAPTPFFFAAIFGVTPATSISPSGQWFVDRVSTVSTPPEILLRDTRTGAVAGKLEHTDVTGLLEAGYPVPEQFRVTADDGETDLWGYITLPPDLPPGTRVPVIDLMYAGFQVVTQASGWLSGGGNEAWAQLGAAYAALGFASIVMDGRGTSGRDRKFRQWTHGAPSEPRGLEDHVTALRALAERYPIDLDRVGVTGHSYGGYNSVRSMLYFPEFFKVAVSSCGVHDAAKMPHGSWDWFLGKAGKHDPEALRDLGNLHLAERLQGKLLLLTADHDANATMDHTFALIRALIAADRPFDLKVWPGGDHYNTTNSYTRTVLWDYFTEHLLNSRGGA